MVCAENLIRKPVDLALHSKLISVGMHDQEDIQVDVWAQNLPFSTAELQPLAVLWLYGRAYFWHPNPGRMRSKHRNWDHTLSQAPFRSQGLYSGRSAFWRAVSHRPSPILVWLICPLREVQERVASVASVASVPPDTGDWLVGHAQSAPSAAQIVNWSANHIW